VWLNTRLKLTGLFKLWIALHSSSHSVMSQRHRSSSSIFHRHVARTFAPKFPILFKLKLSFFICTERRKTEVTCALKIEVINKVDWIVIHLALFNFLNIFTASNEHSQHPAANLVVEIFEKQGFVVSLQRNLFVWWLQNRMKLFSCWNWVRNRFLYLVVECFANLT